MCSVPFENKGAKRTHSDRPLGVWSVLAPSVRVCKVSVMLTLSCPTSSHDLRGSLIAHASHRTAVSLFGFQQLTFFIV